MTNPKQWVALYGDYLFSIAMLRVNHREAAEDLVQETFLSGIKALSTFRGESSEKTWLVSILNRKVIDYYRKKDVLKNTDAYLTETEEQFQASFFQSDEYSEAHWKKDTMPQPWHSEADSQIHENEFHAILERCVGKMPEKLRAIFVAKFVEENDAENICKEYEISSSNYWVIIHRAKLLMRACLDKNWLNPSPANGQR